MITTATGLVAIENIQPGDMVLAANEETGEVAYKEVVRTFVNTTDEYGGHLIKSTVIREFKKAVTAIGTHTDSNSRFLLEMGSNYSVRGQVRGQIHIFRQRKSL